MLYEQRTILPLAFHLEHQRRGVRHSEKVVNASFLTMKHNRKTNESSINFLNQFKFYIYLNMVWREDLVRLLLYMIFIGFGGCDATAVLAGDTV